MRTLIFILSFSLTVGVSANSSKKKFDSKSPEFGLKVAQVVPSEWIFLKVLRRHLKPQDYEYLKFKGDNLGLRYTDRLPMSLVKGRKFRVGNISKPFEFDRTGKVLLFQGKKYRLNKNKSLRVNYMALEAFLKQTPRKYSRHPLFIPPAYAGNVKETNAYHLTVLMYYMHVHTDSNGGLMEDFFFEDQKVQAALDHLRGSGKRIKNVACDDLGMIMEYDDDTSGYLTRTDQRNSNGAKLRLTEQKNKEDSEKEYFSGDKDQSLIQLGHFRYCESFSEEQREQFAQRINGYIEDQRLVDKHRQHFGSPSRTRN